jgi:hypothetical protein
MSNVLPESTKNAVWGMYRTRFIIAAALILMFAAVFSALALSPSYVVLSLQNENTPPQQSGTAASQDDRTAIAHTQALITALSPLLATTSATALIARALSVRPAGVSIDHITATAGAPGTIIFSGTAAQIDAISTYQSALIAGKQFLGVSVPVGDLAGTADGTFSITLSANF